MSIGVTRRVDRCLLVGDVPTVPVVPDGWLAVLVAPDLEVTADDLAEPVRAGLGGDSVLLLAAGPLGADLAAALDRPVVAPDGPVVQTPGGILVTTDIAGGWWRHRPGRAPEPSARAGPPPTGRPSCRRCPRGPPWSSPSPCPPGGCSPRPGRCRGRL
ncbi:hypothetical protein [Dactylosporangium cerinum]